LVLGSINFCYCYFLYVAEAVVSGPRILEIIYPIGWRWECDEKVTLGGHSGGLSVPVRMNAGGSKGIKMWSTLSRRWREGEQGGGGGEKGRNIIE